MHLFSLLLEQQKNSNLSAKGVYHWNLLHKVEKVIFSDRSTCTNQEVLRSLKYFAYYASICLLKNRKAHVNGFTEHYSNT